MNKYGTTGSDTLNGSGASDYLYGSGGNDVIRGGGGNDWIFGGTGNDILRGGTGADTFLFGRGDGRDTVRDVSFDEGDSVILRGYGRHEVSMRAVDGGVQIDAGGMGGQGPGHATIFLQGVELADMRGALQANGDIVFA